MDGLSSGFRFVCQIMERQSQADSSSYSFVLAVTSHAAHLILRKKNIYVYI